MKRLVFLGMAVMAVAGLLAASTVIAMSLALRADVASLEKRSRNAARTEKALRADLVELQDQLAALETTLAQPESREAEEGLALVAAAPAAALPAAVAADAPRVIKANAARIPECVFRPGDAAALADCIRQREAERASERAQDPLAGSAGRRWKYH